MAYVVKPCLRGPVIRGIWYTLSAVYLCKVPAFWSSPPAASVVMIRISLDEDGMQLSFEAFEPALSGLIEKPLGEVHHASEGFVQFETNPFPLMLNTPNPLKKGPNILTLLVHTARRSYRLSDPVNYSD